MAETHGRACVVGVVASGRIFVFHVHVRGFCRIWGIGLAGPPCGVSTSRLRRQGKAAAAVGETNSHLPTVRRTMRPWRTC